MPSKKHRPEEIIGKLREAEVLLAQEGDDGGSLPSGRGQRENLLSGSARNMAV